MRDMEELFFELFQVALGHRDTLSHYPSETEWRAMFTIAQTQAVVGIAFDGIKLLGKNDQKPPLALLYKWIGLSEQIKKRNLIVDKRCQELEKILNDGGFKCCVLKGQGTALYYEHPEYRQCGDIDIWVKGDRDEILGFARKKGCHIGHIDIKHSDIDFFEDVSVEVHFLPSWMYNPVTNKKLQKFFEKQSSRQFDNFGVENGFTHTTVDFDLVFSIVHIYRHIFSEGIGLRQLMDYYYILQNSTQEQRKEAYDVLRSLKMSSFVGGIMWILRNCFGMKDEYLLCPMNIKHGRFLLSEILTAGNFGQYDVRTKRVAHNKRFVRGFVQFKKNLRFVYYYPSEVLWSPFWKLWHYFWRKRKGYL